MPKQVLVAGAFDDIRSRHLRFLEEAARLGDLTVCLWADSVVRVLTSKPPKFPAAERRYLLSAVRYVRHVHLVEDLSRPDELPQVPGLHPDVWVVGGGRANADKSAHARARGVAYHVLGGEQLKGFPDPTAQGRDAFHRVPDLLRTDEDGVESVPTEPKKKVVVTGCYDWLHSGHVRFFEEVSAYGDLYVIVGNDANLRLLKGKGHPLIPQDERRYVVGSIKHVKQALITSGQGWLDADPEIRQIKPDLYAVNEDGDRGGKREYCQQRGIEYLVLKRTPAPGLPQRTSTDLRGY